MKKSIVSVFCILLFVAMCFSLQSCIPTGQDGGGNNGKIDNNNGDTKNESDTFFDINNLNYSVGSALDTTEAKGFLLYDDVDFNSVGFDSNVIDESTIYFEVWFGGEKQKTLYKSFRYGFEQYRVSQKGEYTVKVFAEKVKGEKVNDIFKLNVISKGRPDSVEFEIKNSKGVIVDNVKGGDSYTFTAKIYSDGEEIILKNEDFYWEKPANAGIKEYQYTVGNVTCQSQKKFDFYCFATNNTGAKINIVNSTFNEVDNLVKTSAFPEGIYFSYGVDTTKKVTLDVNANSSYFYDGITAQYRFDNGETKEVPISNKHEEGKFSMFVSYGEDTPGVYSLSNYDYSTDSAGNKITNYFDNGVKYQFDPTKDNAKVYLAVWQRRVSEVSYTLFPSKIESSMLDIDLIRHAPDAFEIKSLSGSHKNDTTLYSKSCKSFTKNITNGSVDLYVVCDMDGDGSIVDEYYGKTLSDIEQYFMLNVDSNTGSLWDYTMEVTYDGVSRPISFQKYENSALGIFDRYFVSPNLGSAQITVRSKFTDKVSTVTVNIIDKVFDSARQIDGDSLSDYFVFSIVDFSQKVKIKEYRLSSYSNDNYYLRSLRVDENLEYLRSGKVTSPNSFAYADNGERGQTITIRIAGTSITRDVTKVYIIPKFAFFINGNHYEIGDISTTEYYVEKIDSEVSPHPSKDFYGNTLALEYIKGQETVNLLSFVFDEEYADLEGTATSFSYQFFDKENKFEVRHRFDYFLAGTTNTYDVKILKIYVK